MRTVGLVPLERVERTILVLRGRRVILDSELAALYGVTVSVFNQAVKRNAKRFPADFAFQLTREDYEALRSQTVISKTERRGGRQYLPYAFTEHGAVMAATVLNSPKAVEMSVEVVRAFVRLRQILASNRQLAAKVEEIERRLATHDKTLHGQGENIKTLIAVIENLLPDMTEKQIGFRAKRLPPAE
ncbi:MAG TPA: ORF6N domain-containing protein [Polyangia bacterium]